MFKKTMTYTNYDGEEITEDFYFNLTKAELVEMQTEKEGGLDSYLEKIVNAKSTPEIMKTFKMLLEKSYGVKSPDGKRFIKNQTVLDEFKQTPAYSDLFMLLATDDNEAAKFVNALLPKDLVAQMNGAR